MVKKARNGAAEPTAATPVASRDAFQRLSFLYQASTLLHDALQQRPTKRRRLTKDRTSGSASGKGMANSEAASQYERSGEEDKGEGTSAGHATAAAPSDGVSRLQDRRHAAEAPLRPLARYLAREMSEVAKKATVRIDPDVKRTVCQGCGTVLVPGVSSRLRVKPSGPHAHVIVHHCLSCRTQRRLPAPPHLPPPVELANSPPAIGSALPPPHLSKRERREARQAQAPVFFEREGHVVVRGSDVVSRDDYREP